MLTVLLTGLEEQTVGGHPFPRFQGAFDRRHRGRDPGLALRLPLREQGPEPFDLLPALLGIGLILGTGENFPSTVEAPLLQTLSESPQQDLEGRLGRDLVL